MSAHMGKKIHARVPDLDQQYKAAQTVQSRLIAHKSTYKIKLFKKDLIIHYMSLVLCFFVLWKKEQTDTHTDHMREYPLSALG